MATAVAQKTQTQLVNFDTEGNVVVNKTSDASSKLIARRAIEAHLERKSMHLDDEWDLDD